MDLFGPLRVAWMLQAWSETVIKQLCTGNKYRAKVLAGFNDYPLNTVGLNRICGESWQLTSAPHPCGLLQVVIGKIEDRFLGPSDYLCSPRPRIILGSLGNLREPSFDTDSAMRAERPHSEIFIHIFYNRSTFC